MFIVTTPADDPLLLTVEQIRVAAGLAEGDDRQDEALTLLNARISGEIIAACNVAAADEAREPTLRQETLSETFRRPDGELLILSRRHNVEIISAAIDGTELPPADYEVDAGAGLLYRLRGDRPSCWSGNKAVIVYKAGFLVVPPALVAAASDLVRFRCSELERDPLARSERVKTEGVDEVAVEYWVNAVTSGSGSASGSSIPPNIAAALSRFATPRCV